MRAFRSGGVPQEEAVSQGRGTTHTKSRSTPQTPPSRGGPARGARIFDNLKSGHRNRGPMASRPVLYSMPISHYCVCADRTLAFKGISFDTVDTPYHDRQALIKATGQDYVPTLVWDGKPVMWADIPDFLEKAKPTPTLYPWNQRGLASIVENWGHQVLEERVWRYAVTKVPPVLKTEQERWVFEEMQTRARGPWHVLEMRRGGVPGEKLEQPPMVEGKPHGGAWGLWEAGLRGLGRVGGAGAVV